MSTVQTLMTAEEFRTMPDVERYELVRGVPIELTRPNFEHGVVCGNVSAPLHNWARDSDSGYVVPNDSGVVTERDPDSVRGPDCMFVRKDRVATLRSLKTWLEIAPDLVVEVRSPSDRWSELLAKVAEYLAAGVAEVWVLDPDARTVEVFRPDEPPTRLGEDATITTQDVLPGFSFPVGEFFRGL